MSYPEVLLWQHLRGKAGIRFRRQHPIGPYIVDFCCVSRRLVVEVDGEVHSDATQLTRDRLRDAFLAENGYRVVRVRAAEVLKDAEQVALSIESLAARPLHHASHGPPPRAGEDQE